MRFNQSEVPVADFIRSAVYNGDPNAAINGIPAGSPVVLYLQGVASTTGQDGLQVCLPSTAGPTLTLNGAYGVANGNLMPNVLGEVTIFGIVRALIGGQTRSASTVNFAAVTLGPTTTSGTGFAPPALSIDTVNNVFTTMAQGTNSPNYILLDQIVAPSVASNTTNTSLINPVLGRVFVRLL